jgi:hypothetical protein
VEVKTAAVESTSADAATVAVELVSIDRTPEGDVSKRFAGTWQLVHEVAGWHLDRPHIRLVDDPPAERTSGEPGTHMSDREEPQRQPSRQDRIGQPGNAAGKLLTEEARDIRRRLATQAAGMMILDYGLRGAWTDTQEAFFTTQMGPVIDEWNGAPLDARSEAALSSFARFLEGHHRDSGRRDIPFAGSDVSKDVDTLIMGILAWDTNYRSGR